MIARWTEIRIRKDLKSLNPKLSQSQFNKKRRVLLKKTKNQSLDKDHNNRVNNNTLMKKTIHKVKDQEATLNKNKNKNKELKNPINKKKVENMKSKDHRWVRMKRKVGHTNKRRKNLYLQVLIMTYQLPQLTTCAQSKNLVNDSLLLIITTEKPNIPNLNLIPADLSVSFKSTEEHSSQITYWLLKDSKEVLIVLKVNKNRIRKI